MNFKIILLLAPSHKHLINTGALMEKIPKNIYRIVCDVCEKCKMADFGAQKILNFKPEMGYGYYEFKEDAEYLNLDKNVVLMHKV